MRKVSLEATEKATDVAYRQKVRQYCQIWATFSTVMLRLERVADKRMHQSKRFLGLKLIENYFFFSCL